jgi:hypothetical protein
MVAEEVTSLRLPLPQMQAPPCVTNANWSSVGSGRVYLCCEPTPGRTLMGDKRRSPVG